MLRFIFKHHQGRSQEFASKGDKTGGLGDRSSPAGSSGRDRGRGTYTAGTVNSVPLLKVGRKSMYFPSHFHDLMSPKCTKLHRFAPIFLKKFSGGNTPDPQNWEAPPRLLPQRPPTFPLFHSFRGCWPADRDPMRFGLEAKLSEIN